MQKFETLTKLKTSNNHLFIFTSTSTYLRFSIALPSSFPHLLVRIAPFIVRLLFVFSSSARAARTVFCSFFVRSLFVFCSSFVRLFFICSCVSLRHLFVSFFRYYTPSPWERVGKRIFCSSACAARTICLSC